MNLFKRAANFLSKAAKGSAFSVFMPQRIIGGSLTNNRILTDYGKWRLLRQVVDKIAEIGAAVDWIVVDKDGERILNSPLEKLMDDGNSEFPGLVNRALIIKHLCLANEAILLKRAVTPGQPVTDLWPIPPNWITQRPALGEGIWEINANQGKSLKFKPEDICHIKIPDPSDPYLAPIGVAESLGDILETDVHARQFTKTFFKNNARPDIIIASDDPNNPIGKEAKEALEESWLQKFSGALNRHKPFFLPGKIWIKELMQSFKDLALKEVNDSDRDAVLQFYGFPPEIFGIVESSNQATSKEAMRIALRFVIVPKLELIKASLNKTLSPLFGDNVFLDFINPIQEDKADKIEIMGKHPHAFSLNEIRRSADEPAIDGGDDLFAIPFNITIGGVEGAAEPAERSMTIINRKTGLMGPQALITKQGTPLTDREIENALMGASASSEAMVAMREVIRDFGEDQFDQLDIAFDFNLADTRSQVFLSEFGADRVRAIDETTRRAVKATLAEGVAAGDSFTKLTERITQVFDVRLARAESIARTETVRGSSFSAELAMKQAGISEKMWLASFDSSVRDSHVALDGNVVKVGKDFRTPDGDTGAGPGQFSRPENSINCRCAVLAVTPEARAAANSVDFRLKVSKIFDDRRRSHERRLRRIFKRSFRDQERAIIMALENSNNNG